MNDSERRQDGATTTEQVAAAGTADHDRTSPGQHPGGDGQAGPPASATQATAGDGLGGGEQPPAQLQAGPGVETGP